MRLQAAGRRLQTAGWRLQTADWDWNWKLQNGDCRPEAADCRLAGGCRKGDCRLNDPVDSNNHFIAPSLKLLPEHVYWGARHWHRWAVESPQVQPEQKSTHKKRHTQKETLILVDTHWGRQWFSHLKASLHHKQLPPPPPKPPIVCVTSGLQLSGLILQLGPVMGAKPGTWLQSQAHDCNMTAKAGNCQVRHTHDCKSQTGDCQLKHMAASPTCEPKARLKHCTHACMPAIETCKQGLVRAQHQWNNSSCYNHAWFLLFALCQGLQCLHLRFSTASFVWPHQSETTHQSESKKFLSFTANFLFLGFSCLINSMMVLWSGLCFSLTATRSFHLPSAWQKPVSCQCHCLVCPSCLLLASLAHQGWLLFFPHTFDGTLAGWHFVNAALVGAFLGWFHLFLAAVIAASWVIRLVCVCVWVICPFRPLQVHHPQHRNFLVCQAPLALLPLDRVLQAPHMAKDQVVLQLLLLAQVILDGQVSQGLLRFHLQQPSLWVPGLRAASKLIFTAARC